MQGDATIKYEPYELLLKNALYVPDAINLISIRVLDREGYASTFKNGRCVITDNKGQIIFQTPSNSYGKLYTTRVTFANQPVENTILTTTVGDTSTISINVAHLRMGHASNEYIWVKYPHLKGQRIEHCSTCAITKITTKRYTKKANEKRNNKAKIDPTKKLKHMEMIVADTKESSTPSVRGRRYATILVGERCGIPVVFTYKYKNDFEDHFKTWAIKFNARFGYWPAQVKHDQGTEFMSHDLREWCNERGIFQSITATNAHNQNAKAERAIRTLWYRMRAMLVGAGAEEKYWDYALEYACLISQYLPSKSLDMKTPIEIFPDYWKMGHLTRFEPELYVWGCEVTIKAIRQKANENSGHRGIFLGISDKIRGYIVLDLERGKPIVSESIIAHEQVFPFREVEKGKGLPSPDPNRTTTDSTELTKVEPLPRLPEWEPLPDEDDRPVKPSLNHLTNEFKLIPIEEIEEHYPIFDPNMSNTELSENTEKEENTTKCPNGSETETPSNQNVDKVVDITTTPDSSNDSVNLETQSESKLEQKPTRKKKMYEVEKIVNHKQVKGTKVYHVKWKGYRQKTWEPEENLTDFTRETYWNQYNAPQETTHENVPLRRSSRIAERVRNFSDYASWVHETTAYINSAEDLSPYQETTSTIGNTTTLQEDFFQPEDTILSVETSRTRDISHLLVESALFTSNTRVSNHPEYSKEREFTDKINVDRALLESGGVDVIEVGTDHNDIVVPKTRSEMLKSPHKEQFLEAERTELKGLASHGTYIETNIPPNRIPISCRWVYAVKRDNNNKVILFKARLVAHGFKQVPGVDFHETFASVSQTKTYRLLRALEVLYGWKSTQYDIAQAFLHGELKETIFMCFPPGYEPKDWSFNTCWKLLKGLYGLKQAGRIWQQKMLTVFKKGGLVQCHLDPGVLHDPKPGNSKMLVNTHVDDFNIFTKDEKRRKEIENLLGKHFIVKPLGPTDTFIGIQSKKIPGRTPKENTAQEKFDCGDKIILHQTAYIKRLVAKYDEMNMKDCKTVNYPEQNVEYTRADLPKNDDEEKKCQQFPYRNAVGSVMYAAICTRADIMHISIRLAKYVQRWGFRHIAGLKFLMKYLATHPERGITYTRTCDFDGIVEIIAFSDSNWGNDPETRRSTGGYVIYIAFGPVIYKSQVCKTILGSTAEAEFYYLNLVAKELVWLTNFLQELGIPFKTPKVFCDNNSAIQWSQKAAGHAKNKHVAIRELYVRDLVEKETIEVYRVDSVNNVSDLFTKATDNQTFTRLVNKLMGTQMAWA